MRPVRHGCYLFVAFEGHWGLTSGRVPERHFCEELVEFGAIDLAEVTALLERHLRAGRHLLAPPVQQFAGRTLKFSDEFQAFLVGRRVGLPHHRHKQLALAFLRSLRDF